MKKICLILICVFGLTSCSTKIAYNFLEIILQWYVGKYVSLDNDQKKFFKAEAKDFHNWHRHTQLDIYANTIDEIIADIHGGEISGEWIHEKTDTLQNLLDSSVAKIKPTIAELIASMSDEQGNEILENLQKNRKKYSKRYVDVSQGKTRKLRKNELIDSIGPFFGKLTDQQKTWIESWLDDLQDYEQGTVAQKTIWAEKVEAALSVRHDREALIAQLDQIIFYRSDDWQQDFQDIIDHNQEITYDLLARLVNSQSPEQRKKMIRKLTKYRDDFRELARAT